MSINRILSFAIAGMMLLALAAPFAYVAMRNEGARGVDPVIAEIRKRQTAEKARWNSLTPQEQAAEIAERAAADAKRREEDALVASVRKQITIAAQAKSACQSSISRVLNDPYSARFDDPATWPVSHEQPDIYVARPSLRAKNSFGAYVYSTWICSVRETGGSVRVIGLMPE